MNVTELAALASAAGFAGSDANVAAAIALAESAGNPSNVGDQELAPDNGPSLGLWQINIGAKAHPEFANWNLFDPQVNARAAYSIYSRAGGSFHEWTTYAHGQFMKFMPASVPIVIDADTGIRTGIPIPTASAPAAAIAPELLDMTAAGIGVPETGGVWSTLLLVGLGLLGLWLIEEAW